MNHVYKIGVISLLMFALSSCARENDVQTGEGYLDLRVEYNPEVEVIPIVKSLPEESQIAVSVVKESDGTEVFSVSDKNLLPSSLPLQTGSYKAFASSGVDAGAAAFDSPFYFGQTEFTITPRQVTTASIECSLTTLMVTTSFSQDIKDNFLYKLEVSNDVATLVFNSENEDKEAYFAPTGSLTWELTLVNEKNEVFVISDRYDDVSASQHYKLSFSMEVNQDAMDVFGAGSFKIILNDSLNEPTHHTPAIMIYESAPSVAGPDNISKYVTDPLEDAAYLLHSSREYTTVELTHDSDVLASFGLPKMVELTTTSVEELMARTGIAITLLDASENPVSSFGPTVQDVKLDFAPFYNSLPVGEYTFIIRIKNIGGMAAVKKIALTIQSSFSDLTIVPWAEFMYVKGFWLSQNQPENINIQYKKKTDSVWTDFVAETPAQYTINSVDNSFKIFVCGINASCEYEVRVVSSTETASSKIAITESADQLYNSNFDEYHYTNTYWFYPSGAPAKRKVWDTANAGLASYSSIIGIDSNTKPSTSVTYKGSPASVQMESVLVDALVMTKFAAGNIYTGKFNGTVGTTGADLDWGVAFTSRPLGLRGAYRYDPKPMSQGSYNIGDLDMCQIQIVLQDAGKPYKVVPTEKDGQSINGPTLDGKNYVDLSSHESVIARGLKNYGSTNGGWEYITLPFEYRSLIRRPTHAVVTFTSSYLGDYFTGGEGSTMWADEFDYVYDPLKLDDSDRDAFFALFD